MVSIERAIKRIHSLIRADPKTFAWHGLPDLDLETWQRQIDVKRAIEQARDAERDRGTQSPEARSEHGESPELRRQIAALEWVTSGQAGRSPTPQDLLYPSDHSVGQELREVLLTMNYEAVKRRVILDAYEALAVDYSPGVLPESYDDNRKRLNAAAARARTAIRSGDPARIEEGTRLKKQVDEERKIINRSRAGNIGKTMDSIHKYVEWARTLKDGEDEVKEQEPVGQAEQLEQPEEPVGQAEQKEEEEEKKVREIGLNDIPGLFGSTYRQVLMDSLPLDEVNQAKQPDKRKLYTVHREAIEQLLVNHQFAQQAWQLLNDEITRLTKKKAQAVSDLDKDALDDFISYWRGLLNNVNAATLLYDDVYQYRGEVLIPMPDHINVESVEDGLEEKITIQLALGGWEEAPRTVAGVVEMVQAFLKQRYRRGSMSYVWKVVLLVQKLKIEEEAVVQTEYFNHQIATGNSWSDPEIDDNVEIERPWDPAFVYNWILGGFVKCVITITRKQIGNIGDVPRFDLPEKIINKKALIQLRDKTLAPGECFKRALIMAGNKDRPDRPGTPGKRTPQRTGKVSTLWSNWSHIETIWTADGKEKELDWTGFKFPTTEGGIRRFAIKNNLAINVYCLRKEGGSVIVDILFKAGKMPKNHKDVIHLLCQDDFGAVEPEGQAEHAGGAAIEDGSSVLRRPCGPVRHMLPIMNLSALLRDQLSEDNSGRHICPNCMRNCESERTLDDHYDTCLRVNTKGLLFVPPKDPHLRFKHYKFTQRVPVIGAFDVETYFKGEKREHVPMMCAFGLWCTYTRKELYFRVYHGEGCVEEMFKDMLVRVEEFYPKRNYEIIGERVFQSGKDRCVFCDEVLYGEVHETPEVGERYTKSNGDDVVMDHDHFVPGLGENNFRGFAHRRCNLTAGVKDMAIPILGHNIEKYDMQFVYKHLVTDNIGDDKVKGMYQGGNVVRNLSFDKIRFVDTTHFMKTSLDSWVESTKRGKELYQFRALMQQFGPERAKLFWGKAPFPYEFFDSIDKLEVKELPGIKEFFSSLKRSGISQEEYDLAVQIWILCGCKTMKDFCKLYVTSDVCLLADCWFEFTNAHIKLSGIDPGWLMGSAMMTMQNALKHSKKSLKQQRWELETDEKGVMMTLECKRGGYTAVYKHYVVAGEGVFIHPIDATNLYGTGTLGRWPMPVGDYKMEGGDWLNKEKFPGKVLELNPMEDERGYMFEVDIEYRKEMHDELNAFPPIIERTSIKTEDLGELEKNMMRLIGMKHCEKSETLLQTFWKKEHYVVHGALLRYWIEKDWIVITKVHRVKSFKQSKFLCDYINHLGEMRQKAVAAGDKVLADSCKLLINSLYGKMGQDDSRYNDTEFTTERKVVERRVNDFRYDGMHKLNKELRVISKKKTKATYKSPMIIATAVLDISKLIMLEFFYDVIRRYWPDAEVIYTDTDSFILQTSSSFMEMAAKEKGLRDRMDLSDITDQVYEQVFKPRGITREELNKNRKAPGTFGSDTRGQDIDEIICLSPKMYAYTMGTHAAARAKGIRQSVQPMFPDYKRIMKGEILTTSHTSTAFRRQDGGVRTVEETKVGLRMINKKRVAVVARENGTPDPKAKTLAYGHWRLESR